MNLNELCTSLAELKKKLDLEEAARAEVRNDPAYLLHSKEIERLLECQNGMLEGLPDSSAEYASLRQQVIDQMNKEGVWAIGSVSAKFKERNEVNTSKVLSVIGGDMDSTSPRSGRSLSPTTETNVMADL